MEATKEKSNVHHGKNILIARNVKGIKQEAVAKAIDMYQSDYSKLEKKEKIDIEILERIAKFLDADIKFLTDFVANDTVGNYMDNHEYSVNDHAQYENENYSDKNIDIDKNVEYNNSVPETVLNKYITKTDQLYKENSDLRVFIAKNGLEYPQEKQK